MKKLLVFLGNPGKDYVNTRHNAGFLLADSLFPSLSWQSKFHSMYSETGEYRIIKPLTYMNLSGTAVSECATFYKIKPKGDFIEYWSNLAIFNAPLIGFPPFQYGS